MRPLTRVVLLITLLQLACSAQVPDRQIYNRVGTLKGRVIIANHAELGRTPATGWYFLLQRLDCADCLIGVHTDIEGRYEVAVGVGRYRVISYDPVSEGRDFISRRQEREVTVRPPSEITEFDIELEIPTRK